MLVRYFNRPEPLSVLFLLLILALWVFGFGFFSSSHLAAEFSFLNSVVRYIFIATLLLLYIFTIQKKHVTQKGYLAGFLFVLFTISVYPALILSASSFALFFQFLSFSKVMNFNVKTRQKFALFDAGFYTGIAFLLFPESIIFSLLILVGFFYFVKIISKHIFIPFVGFSFPIFLFYTYAKITNQNLIIDFPSFSLFQWSSPLYITIPTIVLGFITLLIGMLFSLKESFSSLEVEGNYKMSVLYLMLGMIGMVLFGDKIGYFSIFLIFPYIVIWANAIQGIKKKWQRELVLYLLVAWTFWQVWVIV